MSRGRTPRPQCVPHNAGAVAIVNVQPSGERRGMFAGRPLEFTLKLSFPTLTPWEIYTSQTHRPPIQLWKVSWYRWASGGLVVVDMAPVGCMDFEDQFIPVKYRVDKIKKSQEENTFPNRLCDLRKPPTSGGESRQI